MLYPIMPLHNQDTSRPGDDQSVTGLHNPVVISLEDINNTVWGADADDFRPERRLDDHNIPNKKGIIIWNP